MAKLQFIFPAELAPQAIHIPARLVRSEGALDRINPAAGGQPEEQGEALPVPSYSQIQSFHFGS